MKSVKFKLLSAIITVLMLAGCSLKGQSKESYVMKKIVPKGIEGTYNCFAMDENKIYLNSYVWNEAVLGYEAKLYCLDKEFQLLEEIPVDIIEYAFIEQMLILDHQQLLLEIDKLDEEGNYLETVLAVLDETGNVKQLKAVSEIVGEGDQIKKIMVSDHSSVILVSQNKLYFLDSNLERVNIVAAPEEIETAGITSNGKIVCLSPAKYDDVKSRIYENCYDLQAGQWAEPTYVNLIRGSGRINVINGIDSYYYFVNDVGIYGVDEKGKSEFLIDFRASNVSLNDVQEIVALKDDEFLRIGVNQEKETTYFAKYYKGVPETKKTIVLGGIYVSQGITEQVYAFNNSNDEFEIQVKDYSENQGDLSVTDLIDRVNAEFVSGAGPDILYLDALPVMDYVKKGMLVKLDEFMDGDQETSMNDFIPSVKDAMLIDGGLYYVSPSFSPYVLVSKKRMIGSGDNLTMKDLYEAWKNNQKPSIFAAPPYISLYYLLTHLVDGDEINKEDVAMALEICMDSKNLMSTLADSLEEDKVMLYSVSNASPMELEVIHAVFGEDITIMGYPGRKDAAVYATFTDMLAISSKSEYKDVAWQFLRSVISDENQDEGRLVSHYPIRQEAFDKMLSDLSNGDSSVGDEAIGNTWERFGMTGKYEKLSQDDVAMIRGMVSSISRVNYEDLTLYSLIKEEAGPYFNHEKSLEDAMDSMQKRLTLYFKE
ncbi:MAG: extracellular solute-binding protein [Acetatifactor sp.]|nr:extracellular solute-binding protein [Acetatifactor sp.]